MGITMREFHLHTRVDGTLHQAVLVSVTRNKEQRTLEIHEICIVMQNGNQESKTILHMEGLTDIMAIHEDGNIDPRAIPTVKSIFYEMLSEESKQEMDLQEFMGDLHGLDETERLLVASEAALSAHPVNQSIEELVNERLQDPTHKR